LIKDFLDKNNLTKLEHPSDPSDLATADFDLFPRLIFSLKGRGFCDATNIIKNVWVEMKRLSQNGFQECFQQLYSHWKEFRVPQRDYLQRNIA